jgi:enoyl-CoA hydratase
MSVVVDDVTRAPVRIVTIANASKGNALTKPMLRALAQACRDVPSTVRGIVLCADASSANFCTGIDLAAAAEVFATDETDVDDDPVYALERCATPTVCAVHGACVNAGFELALACDVVVAASSATFRDTHAAIGIVPSWGLSVKLSRIIGSNEARAVSVFGKVLTSVRARELGLVVEAEPTSAVEALEEAATMVRSMARSTPIGGAEAVKRAINDGLDIERVRAEERRRAFAQYRAEARVKFETFRKKTSSKL